jgi:hypothetical protein
MHAAISPIDIGSSPLRGGQRFSERHNSFGVEAKAIGRVHMLRAIGCIVIILAVIGLLVISGLLDLAF